MFSRRERLSRAGFSDALSAGRRLSSNNFSIVIPRKSKGYAVIVSKKVARLSVTRHVIKRRVLAALRVLTIPQSLVVYPKSSVSGMRYHDIKTELVLLLSKISN